MMSHIIPGVVMKWLNLMNDIYFPSTFTPVLTHVIQITLKGWLMELLTIIYSFPELILDLLKEH